MSRRSVAARFRFVFLVVAPAAMDPRDFSSLERILAHSDLRVAITSGGDLARRFRQEFPQVGFVEVDSDREYLQGELPDVDGLVSSAEVGAVYSMLYPEFAVVVPRRGGRRFPLIVGVRGDAPELKQLLDTWIELKHEDGSIRRATEYWIMGRDVTRHTPRWSILRDVLGWVE